MAQCGWCVCGITCVVQRLTASLASWQALKADGERLKKAASLATARANYERTARAREHEANAQRIFALLSRVQAVGALTTGPTPELLPPPTANAVLQSWLLPAGNDSERDSSVAGGAPTARASMAGSVASAAATDDDGGSDTAGVVDMECVPLTVRVLHAPPVLTAPISDARYDPAVSAHGDVPKGSMLAELVRAAGEELRGVRVLGPCGTCVVTTHR